jgi:hypothetical protein
MAAAGGLGLSGGSDGRVPLNPLPAEIAFIEMIHILLEGAEPEHPLYVIRAEASFRGGAVLRAERVVSA